MLGTFCSKVEVIQLRTVDSSRRLAVQGLLSRQPRSFVDSYSTEMADAIRLECQDRPPELIVASELQMIPYAFAVPTTPAIVEELELQTFYDAVHVAGGFPKRIRALLTWLKLTEYLRHTLPRFAACTVVSEPERAILRRIVPRYRAISVVPNAVDLVKYQGEFGQPRPSSLIFSGALSYQANFDAVSYLLNTIFPMIKVSVPDVELRITGDNSRVDLSSLPRLPRVQFTGYLNDIRPAVAESWASVVPLRIGGGTRLKILEALALGTPVISTSKGAEGLDLTHGKDILIANSPSEFATQTISLLRSPELRQELATNGRRIVAEQYDWKVVGRGLENIVAGAALADVG